MARQRAWQEPKANEPSYLREMLAHQYTLYGFLSTLAAGSLLAIPYDLGVAALPLLGFFGATSLAALFVPSWPGFQQRVDDKRREERRAAARQHLWQELTTRVDAEDPRWQIYGRMVERVAALRARGKRRGSSVDPADVERLDDVTVEYLTLWLSRLELAERRERLLAQDLPAKIATTESKLESSSGSERKRLEQVLGDLHRLLASQQRLETHETAAEAALITLADAFDEVHQGLISGPASSEATRKLQEAVEQLRLEDDLASGIDEDLESMFGRSTNAKAQAQKAR